MLLGEGYRGNPRTPDFSQDLVVVGWVEADGGKAGLLLVQEVDASQEDHCIGARTDVL